MYFDVIRVVFNLMNWLLILIMATKMSNLTGESKKLLFEGENRRLPSNVSAEGRTILL